MLGFPMTVARVLSLSSVCGRRNSTAASTSLQSLCSESTELPPLLNTTISVISGPPPSGYETAKTNKQVKHKTKLLNSTELSSRTSKNAIVIRGHETNFQEQHFLVSTCHIGFHTHLIIELQPGYVFLTLGGTLRW
ncbi:uncharacterized protein LOC133711386 [Rosa rugosa]|uniref:uncharacterized protein LOC133711386 n=1 Tax=Rosa rugosa TaxID=74645 RepID=UPI002B41443F|nr:uncharacterized protein LOC133711386 [Rosa rugosa]